MKMLLRFFSVTKKTTTPKHFVFPQLTDNYKQDPFLFKYYTKSVVTAFRYHSDLELLFCCDTCKQNGIDSKQQKRHTVCRKQSTDNILKLLHFLEQQISRLKEVFRLLSVA